MRLLTIGAFAQAAGLTPKALRLYDQSGLLPPSAVDPETCYRFYDRDQLHQARLIAELRRIGMPLAEIRTVCVLDAAPAADAISAYWARTATEHADRAHLVALLLANLSRGELMSNTTHPRLRLHSATACDRGDQRELNQDAVYASDRLLAVADGGGSGGAAASAAAIEALKHLQLSDVPAAESLPMLVGAVADADRTIRAAAADDDQPISTLTALLRSGSALALVHIGDTRAYLLRGGELFQLTTDHTWVQSQVDQGKLTLDQATVHPDRALLFRALGGPDPLVEADLALRTALPGDRYLLCSDGLSAVVDRSQVQAALSARTGPEETVRQLVGLAYTAGAPDNITCIVADVTTA